MKKIRNRILLPIVALMVAGSFAGCTKSAPTPNDPSNMEITPIIAFSNSSVEAGSKYSSNAQTKAIVNGSEAIDFYFARADETAASTYGDYQTTALLANRTAGTGAQLLEFNPKQYYLANGLNTKLTGWYPGGAIAIGDISGKGFYDGTSHTVSWTIDGQQDVMTTPMKQGSVKGIISGMTFDHRLTQLLFHPYAETQSAVDAWGKITKIEILNQRKGVLYDLAANEATGAVSFNGDASSKFSAGIAAEGASLSLSTTANKVADAKQMGNPVMIAPQSDANYTLTMRITTSNNKYKDVTLTQALNAGAAYRFYMKFTELDITIETTVANWNDVTTTDKVGEVRIGDLMDGGLVFWIDPTNPKRYKVMSLEEAATKLKWAANTSYVVSGAQSDANGKANSEAIKAAFDAKMAGVPITESTFDAAFPAAAYCYNYKGKAGNDAVGSWHLPAKSELQYLWCSYNGVATISWEEAPNDDAPADSAAQTAWNSRITAGGVTAGIASGAFWSSTENSNDTSNAWYVYLSNGDTDSSAKSYGCYVRCVKNITLPDTYLTDDKADSPIIISHKSMESTSTIIWGPLTSIPAVRDILNGKKNTDALMAVNATAYLAAKYCRDLGAKYYLPSQAELMLIWIYTPAILIADLPASGGFWSSTESSLFDSYAWRTSLLDGGSTDSDHKSYSNSVRCFREPVATTWKYPKVDTGNTIVSHDGAKGIKEAALLTTAQKAFLMNQTAPPIYNEQSDYNKVSAKFQVASTDAPTSSSWEGAYTFCRNYSTGAAAGSWRLPTQRELMLIWMFKSKLTGTITSASGYFWSSTENGHETGLAWFVDFSSGITKLYDESTNYYVRCVRDL